MKLTIELDDEALSALKDALRVRHEDMVHVGTVIDLEPKLHHQYALRILQARKALGLSNSSQSCCYDFQDYRDSAPTTLESCCEP